ncbi:hypothetical protein KPH14_011105 [Odynerus spinipes]|uniref:Uncharacterized protein n=1 Tax=Odynerus spinipes TaxID=1348599 RepID=A0AAD9VM88_9HYME|nr:hypothetical protein KPH14_011105 [Odynerus spinipes]
MSTLSSNRLRSSSTTSKWSGKMGDNARKGSLRASSTLDTGWSKDAHTHPLRSTASSTYQPNTCLSGQNLKCPEEKTSEETILVEVDGNKNDVLLRRDHRYLYDYPDMNVSQAMVAMQKLQKLKELQRRRDLTERYYSHEIRKLIGDYFNPNSRLDVSPMKYNNDRIQSTSLLQPCFGDRSNDALKNLEPCGTMTTITRLDCGCIQETTRPIFTTTRGRVQKKTCNQSQDQMLLKLTSSNPQEHLCSSIESPTKTEQYAQKSKKGRVVLDARPHGKNSINVDRELGMEEHDHRSPRNKQETHCKSPGNVPPLRKCSDTSTTSV